ncbi:hypothetical protein TH67_07885 [Campylobacter concisus]|nr:hypothetical protein TH67_07885 [Campylobacter concisus]
MPITKISVQSLPVAFIQQNQPTHHSYNKREKAFPANHEYTLLCFMVFQTILKGHIIFLLMHILFPVYLQLLLFLYQFTLPQLLYF